MLDNWKVWDEGTRITGMAGKCYSYKDIKITIKFDIGADEFKFFWINLKNDAENEVMQKVQSKLPAGWMLSSAKYWWDVQLVVDEEGRLRILDEIVAAFKSEIGIAFPKDMLESMKALIISRDVSQWKFPVQERRDEGEARTSMSLDLQSALNAISAAGQILNDNSSSFTTSTQLIVGDLVDNLKVALKRSNELESTIKELQKQLAIQSEKSNHLQ